MCSSGNSKAAQRKMAEVAGQQVELSREALAWYQAQAEAQKPMQDALAGKALEVSDAQLASMKTNEARAADYDAYNKGTFRPLEQGIVADAENYDTPEKRAAAATSAIADVDNQFARTQAATARRLASMGVDPGSARMAAALDDGGVAQAQASAGAAYQARKGVEATGFARKMDAASLGRNLPSAQATSAQIALQAGNAAVGSAAAPIGTANQTTSVNGQGYQTAVSALNSAGSIYGRQAEIANDDQGLWGALGQLGGAAISRYSDPKLKKDVSEVSDDEALEAVNATGVNKFKYDASKLAAEGIPMSPDMQGEQVGPMADEVAENMPAASAGGGKMVKPADLAGYSMKAVQAVDKKVDRLTQQVAGLAKMIAGGQLTAGAA